MKYLENFENNFFPKKQFRVINLQLLLVDYSEFDKTANWHNICEKFKQVLEPMLIDKEVSFLENNQSIYGRVKNIRVVINDNLNIILKFYGIEISIIIKLGLWSDLDKKIFIKIYNSNQTNIEKQIELNKNMKKYNL